MYLQGYYAALPLEEAKEFGSKLKCFQKWVEKKYKIKSNHHWSQIILFYSPNEYFALNTFFDLFEKFCDEEWTQESDHAKECVVN